MGCACVKPAEDKAAKVEVVIVNSQKPTKEELEAEAAIEARKRGGWLSKGAASVFGNGGLVDVILNGSSGGAGEYDGAGGAEY